MRRGRHNASNAAEQHKKENEGDRRPDEHSLLRLGWAERHGWGGTLFMITFVAITILFDDVLFNILRAAVCVLKLLAV